jgi:VIT1/CCC1 family predicted Fe2+/Mn2+ transporter
VSNAGRVSLAELKRYVNGMLSRIAGEVLEVSSVLLNQITKLSDRVMLAGYFYDE